MALTCGFLTVVVTSLITFTHNMCKKATPVNSPSLSCIQHDGQEYHAIPLFLNNILMCANDLLLIHITSARSVTVSIHVSAWKDKTQGPVVTCHGPIRSMSTSNHGAINASCGGN